MSYAEIKIAKKAGKVSTLKKYSNAWGGAAYVWDTIYDRFLRDPNKEKAFDNWLTDWPNNKIVNVSTNRIVPKWIRLVEMAMCDYAITEYDHLPQMAIYLRDFVKEFPSEGICHLLDWADIMDEIFKKENKNTCAGICFYATSVALDLWEYIDEEDENAESEPYNLSKGNRHWFVFENFKTIEEAPTDGSN